MEKPTVGEITARVRPTGDLSTNRRSSPNPVRFIWDETICKSYSRFQLSYYNTCILTDEGRVMCWGDGSKDKMVKELGIRIQKI